MYEQGDKGKLLLIFFDDKLSVCFLFETQVDDLTWQQESVFYICGSLKQDCLYIWWFDQVGGRNISVITPQNHANKLNIIWVWTPRSALVFYAAAVIAWIYKGEDM